VHAFASGLRVVQKFEDRFVQLRQSFFDVRFPCLLSGSGVAWRVESGMVHRTRGLPWEGDSLSPVQDGGDRGASWAAFVDELDRAFKDRKKAAVTWKSCSEKIDAALAGMFVSVLSPSFIPFFSSSPAQCIHAQIASQSADFFKLVSPTLFSESPRAFVACIVTVVLMETGLGVEPRIVGITPLEVEHVKSFFPWETVLSRIAGTSTDAEKNFVRLL
jgi:hypothetical protein